MKAVLARHGRLDGCRRGGWSECKNQSQGRAGSVKKELGWEKETDQGLRYICHSLGTCVLMILYC